MAKFLDEVAVEFDRLRVTCDRLKTEVAQVAVERDVLQARLKKLTTDVEKLESLLAHAVADRDSLRGRMTRLTAELGTLRTAAQEYLASRQAHEHLLAQVSAERDSLKAKLVEVTAELRAREAARMTAAAQHPRRKSRVKIYLVRTLTDKKSAASAFPSTRRSMYPTLAQTHTIQAALESAQRWRASRRPPLRVWVEEKDKIAHAERRRRAR